MRVTSSDGELVIIFDVSLSPMAHGEIIELLGHLGDVKDFYQNLKEIRVKNLLPYPLTALDRLDQRIGSIIYESQNLPPPQ